jgi:hypothetical protein
VTSSPAGRWLRDTGSILALLAPVAVLLMHASTVRAGWGPGTRVAGAAPEFGPSVWVPLAAWALVVLAALAGLRRAAAAAAWAAALLDVAGWLVTHHRYPQYGWPARGFPLLIGLAATMLTVVPSARAAWPLVGWRRLLSASIVAGYAAAWPFLANSAAIPPWLTSIAGMGPGIRFYGWLACAILLLRLDVPPRRAAVRGLRSATPGRDTAS